MIAPAAVVLVSLRVKDDDWGFSVFPVPLSALQILREQFPDGDDVADGACKDEEVEDGVVVVDAAQAVEECTGDVKHAFGDNPGDGNHAHTCDERLECHEYGQSHQDETGGFQIAVCLEFRQADNRSDNGAEPHEREQSPSPIALVAQSRQRDRRIGTGDVPIDGGVVPFAQAIFPHASGTCRMIDG